MTETVRKVLLLISTTRKSEKSIETALDAAAKNNAELLILFILDDELSQDIMRHMSQEGWYGGKPSEMLRNAILKEYFTQGGHKVKEIEAVAKERGIACRSILARGKFVDVALKVIEREQVDLIIVTRRRRSNLSRFIFGSPVAELQSKVSAEFIIIDE